MHSTPSKRNQRKGFTTMEKATLPETFYCAKCKRTKPTSKDGGTGYARTDRGELVCYACCAEGDREWMKQHGKTVLYLTQSATEDGGTWRISNWPGTLKFDVWGLRTSWHNIGRMRYDCWFHGPDGFVWHAVNIGDNQIARCKRTKEKSINAPAFAGV